MGFIDDISKASALFNEGAQTYAVTSAIGDAQKQISGLQQQQMDEMARRQAMSGIANHLALQLSKTGAPVSQIAQAVSPIAADSTQALQKPSDFLTAGTIAGDKGKGLVAAGEKLGMQEAAPKMAEIGLETASHEKIAKGNNDTSIKTAIIQANASRDAASSKLGDGEIKHLQTVQKAFEKDATPHIETIQKADKVLSLADLKNNIADSAMKDFLARTAGEKGKLPIEVMKLFGGSQAIGDRIGQAFSEAESGKMSDKNRMFTIQLAKTLRSHAEKSVDSLADYHSKQGGALLKMSPNDVKSRIYGGLDSFNSGAPAAMGGTGASSAPLPAGIPKGSQLTTRKRKDGVMMKVYQAPDGTLYPAE